MHPLVRSHILALPDLAKRDRQRRARAAPLLEHTSLLPFMLGFRPISLPAGPANCCRGQSGGDISRAVRRQEAEMRMTIATLFAVVLSACSVTEQDKPATMDQAAASNFLGNTGELRPGRTSRALLVYFNPNANWRQYDKVLLEPVTVGLGPNRNLSDQDQTMLASYYYNALALNLAKDFTMVNQPGPDVMTVRVALTDTTTATPVLRTISVVVPQARVLGAAKNLATGSYAFVGSAQSEGEVLDSMTGSRLAAAVDRRSGGLSVKNADVWEWGDAQHAMDYWAQHWSQALADLHSGKQASSR